MIAIDDGKAYAYTTRDFEDENGRFTGLERPDGTELIIGERADFELMQEPYDALVCKINLVKHPSLEPHGVRETIESALTGHNVPFDIEDGGVDYGHRILYALYVPLELREKAHQILENLGIVFEHVKVKTLHPQTTNDNRILNRIDDLLAEGYTINTLVELLSPKSIIANYTMLVQKGATNIDLAALVDQEAMPRDLADRTMSNKRGNKKLSINMDGKQTGKIFFDPHVQVTSEEGTKNLPHNWAGRILPGQTIKEGIAAELEDVYGYTGRFDCDNIHFSEYVQDNKGKTIERYTVTITLFPSAKDTLKF